MRTGRPPKGPRLYLRERPGRPAVWIIRDGTRQHSTGCGAQDRAGADQALQAYLANKYAPPSGPSSLDKLLIADVINRYLAERAPHVARPDFLQTTAIPILEWWTGKTLADVRGNACRAYVEWRTGKVSLQTARHDLKTLRAAINHYHAEHGPLPAVPTVTLPAAGAPRDRWLTRQEAARLLLAAWRRKETRHVARFLLIALYTGTRSKAVRALRWLASTTGGHVDLDRGVMYRRAAGAAQTKKRAPPVRLPARLLAHMRRWQRADAVHGITHVVHYQGRPVGKLRRSWGTIREAAELGDDVVPHTCRHTAATWLMQRGVDHFEAAGFLGMSVATLEAVYGHHDPDWQRNAAEKISKR
jgi:integrase